MKDGLMAVMALLIAENGAPPPVWEQRVKLVDAPRYTSFYFGPIENIAGKKLKVLERSHRGDCLCLAQDEQGADCLVDVDVRDIEKTDNQVRR